MASTLTEDQLRACDSNYFQATAAFMATSQSGESVESHDLILACCGLPFGEFNSAFPKLPLGDLDALIARARDYFRDRKLPHRFTIRGGSEGELPERLHARGYHEAATVPGMILAPIRAPEGRAPQQALEIRHVRSDGDLEAYRATAFEGFGLPRQAGPLFLGPRLRALEHVRMYLGLVDGEPACTSMLYATGQVAGIYWVATLERFRKRGLGEAITWASVRGGQELGCTLASLQASELGAPVYARMGFTREIGYRHFETEADK